MKNMLLSRTDSTVREVLNLRPALGNQLVPVGIPTKVSSGQRIPIGALNVGGSRRLVFASGSTLSTLLPSGSHAEIPGRLPGAPDCAVALSDERILVMSSGGSAEVTSSGNTVTIEPGPAFSGVSLTATQFEPLTETVSGLKLNDKEADYSRRLAAAEEELVAKGKKAFATLHMRAVNDGRYSSPVVCGFRLLNRRGHEIFRSAPMLLGSGSEPTAIDLYSPDNINISPWQQSLNTWKIHLRTEPSDALDRLVGTLEVVALPQIHAIDPAKGGYAVLTRHSSAQLPFARLNLSEGAGNGYAAARIAALASRLFSSGTVLHSVANPFGSSNNYDLDAWASTTWATDFRNLEKALGAALAPPPTFIQASLSLPHRFTAACGCRSGETILWGNISPVAYSGYPPEMMAAAVTSTSELWSFTMLTFLNDGRRVLSEGTRNSPRPTSLNPLVCYPHPGATEIRLRINWNGGAWRGDFKLRPSECGRFAFKLTENLNEIPITPNGGAAIINVPSADTGYPDLLVAAHASAPTVALECVEMPDGPVRAIIERPGNDTAWDHTRSRFFIGTRGGVHAIGLYVNDRRRTHTLRRLCTAGIRSRGVITPMDEGAVALLDLPAGALPVFLTKNGSMTPLCEPFTASRVCYNPVLRELWAHGAGITRVFCKDYGLNWYTRDDLSLQDTTQVDGLPYGINDSGVYALAEERPYGSTLHIKLEADSNTPGDTLMRLSNARLTASGTDLTLGLEVRRIEPDGSAKEPVVNLGMSGTLRRNPCFHMVSRPLRAIRWCLEGEVDKSFIFKSLEFRYNDYR